MVVAFSAAVIIACFISGVYMGFIYVHAGNNSVTSDISTSFNRALDTARLRGVPGTNNILTKWDTSGNNNNNNLRSEDYEKPSSSIDELAISSVSSAPSELTAVKQSTSVKDPRSAGEPAHELPLSLHATPTSYMEAPAGLDSPHIAIGAWIYLDNAVRNYVVIQCLYMMPKCSYE